MKNMQGVCPVCDATITMPGTTEVSELISCQECKTRLQVLKTKETTISFGQAPKIEEDWGQ